MTSTLLSLNSPSGKDRDVTRKATSRETMGSLSACRKEEVRSCAEVRHGASYPSLCTGETGAGCLSQLPSRPGPQCVCRSPCQNKQEWEKKERRKGRATPSAGPVREQLGQEEWEKREMKRNTRVASGLSPIQW